jgi:hypothetical protein
MYNYKNKYIVSGNSFNDMANTLTKEACGLQNFVYTHNNLINSRIFFILANRNSIVEKNTRRFLKHMMQNIHRAKWSAYHTATRTKQTARIFEIDWKMYKEIFNTNGEQKNGFSFRKTSDLKTYIIKVYTDTLLTFNILHYKWNIYLNNLCSHCTT